jgi:glycosyltransferase involved in cell wall biosynthesis
LAPPRQAQFETASPRNGEAEPLPAREDVPGSVQCLPLISVVTPCLNAASTIADAVESVLSQGYPRLEHVVADGGSRDGTLERLACFPHLRVTSGPDAGMYDALNSAIGRARGDVIVWLNADDLLGKDALMAFGEAFRDDPSVEMACGRCAIVEVEGGRVRIVHENRFTRPADFRAGRITHGGAMLNACAFSRRLLERVGPLDPRYRISGDRDYLVRLSLHAPAMCELDRLTYLYRRHAGSMTFGDRRFDAIRLRQAEERLRLYPPYVASRTVPAPLRDYCRGRFRDEAFELLGHHLRTGAPRRVAGLLRRALAVDRSFPLWAARKWASRLASAR